VRLRDDNVIGREALRRVQNDLDLDEVRSLDGCRKCRPGLIRAEP
jgi:hypothetical protein